MSRRVAQAQRVVPRLPELAAPDSALDAAAGGRAAEPVRRRSEMEEVID